MCEGNCVGAIVCKLDLHRKVIRRGYIAMLAVDEHYRKRGIGSTLVRRAIQEMIAGNADEVVLETEITNKPALQLYEALGFVRDKRLFRYYLNGVDALRLKLWLRWVLCVNFLKWFLCALNAQVWMILLMIIENFICSFVVVVDGFKARLIFFFRFVYFFWVTLAFCLVFCAKTKMGDFKKKQYIYINKWITSVITTNIIT